MLEQVPCGTGTGTGTSIPPHQPHSLEGTLANPSAPSVATQHLRNGSRLSSMGCRHCAGAGPARCRSLSVLPSPVNKPFQTSEMPLQPWACHSPVGSTKGNQALQRSKDKGSRRPSSTAMCPSSPSTFLLLLQKHTDPAKSPLAMTEKGVKMSNCTCVCGDWEQGLWISTNPAPPHPGTPGVHFHGATGLLQYK